MPILGITPDLAWIVLGSSGEGKDGVEFVIFGGVLQFEGVVEHCQT